MERNAVEYAWLLFAGRQRPGCVPGLLGHDPGAGFFAMEFLPPATAPSWKAELMAGRVDPVLAGQVGDVIGQIHAVSAADPQVPGAFATDDNFAALRIEPYFHVTARRNPAWRTACMSSPSAPRRTRVALVHGDLSPKNILARRTGPVILDAECAWFGDPAFDVAFCLTHLVLKTVVRPDRAGQLRDSADALVAGHLAHLSWEPARGSRSEWPRCSPRCCWPASTEPHPWSTSSRRPTRPGSALRPRLCSLRRPAGSPRPSGGWPPCPAARAPRIPDRGPLMRCRRASPAAP